MTLYILIFPPRLSHSSFLQPACFAIYPPVWIISGVVSVIPSARCGLWHYMTALFAGLAHDRGSWTGDFGDIFLCPGPLDDACGRGGSLRSRAGAVGGQPLGVFLCYQARLLRKITDRSLVKNQNFPLTFRALYLFVRYSIFI